MMMPPRIPLSIKLAFWRQLFKLDEKRAARLLGATTFEIQDAERNKLNSMQTGIIEYRLAHVADTMCRCRCIVGNIRTKAL
jgi:hypothetical protein